MDNHVPIVVLNLWDEDSLERVVRGESVGTLIGG
jgi:uridylate kinase